MDKVELRVVATVTENQALDSILELKSRMATSVIGQERMIERLLIGLELSVHTGFGTCPYAI